MAKLYFRYGTVGSAKTLNLLAVAHNYTQQNKPVLLFKPAMDVRFGDEHVVQSRAGLKAKADLLLEKNTDVLSYIKNISGPIYCILVDEAQFLSSHVIDQLRSVSIIYNIPVICYGLRSDFRRNLFEGSRRLLELADSIEEIKTTCYFCNKKAIFNLKLVNNEPSIEGPAIELGFEEKYIPVCSSCYNEKLNIDK